jgi:DNA-binding LacI/PurR family transcriptional regulator
VPTVVAGRPERGPALGSVFCDEGDGAAQLVDHLMALGHQRVAVFLVPVRLSLPIHERGKAMIRRLREAGALVQVMEMDEDPDAAGRGIGSVLEKIAAGEGVTAVMCPTDLAALRALEALDQAGVRVPHDLSVTGFDGLAPLTTPWGSPHCVSR